MTTGTEKEILLRKHARLQAVLESLTLDQREAVYCWFGIEVDYSGLLPSAAWEREWLPNPHSFERDEWWDAGADYEPAAT